MPQSYSSLLTHIVFSTKGWRPLITPQIEPQLYPYLNALCKTKHSPALAIGGASDHVHILCSLARTMSVAEVIEHAKTESSSWIKTKGPEFRSFFWQPGYGAFSIGQSGVPALKRYIANQKEHHKKISYLDELKELLCRYEVAFDEQYFCR